MTVILLPNISLPFSFYRQLLSWYTLSQNPNVSAVGGSPALLPLWVRCDMSDPAGTIWFGAENVSLRDKKVSGFKLYSVTCKGRATCLKHYLYRSHYAMCHFNVFGHFQQGPQQIKRLSQHWRSWNRSTKNVITRLRWVKMVIFLSECSYLVFTLVHAYRC